jgi:DNA-directed RNA polymerase I, II, and III subunit RPABC2
MSDSEDYDIQDVGDEYDDSEMNSIEEIEEQDDGVDILEETEEDTYIDLKFNNRSKFDNFSKVMELSNANYQNTDKKRKTTPQLTKYEKTKILGIRAQQLLSGMPALIKVPKDVNNVRKIAELELKQRKIPFIIKRPLPNKGCEYIKIEDLEYV